MKIIFLLSLLILTACGGYYASPGENYYLPQPIYNTSNGDTVWVNQQCCPHENWKAPYRDYNTNETYNPVYGPGNFYLDSHGNLYKAY